MTDHDSRVLIATAASFAAEAHKNQERKELGEPDILHPLRVGKMASVLDMDAEFIAAAYLHDVLEDTPMPRDTVEALFPARTTMLVDAMTKWWQAHHPAEAQRANKLVYYAKILQTPGAPLLKVLDRIDNLYDFARIARMGAPKSHAWAQRYRDKTIVDFAPLLVALNGGDAADLAAVKWYETALSTLEDAL